MNEQLKNEFIAELRTLTEKYNFKNAVFGGEHENKFIGLISLYKLENLSQFIEITTIAARLYQAAREKIMSCFDDLAR